MFGSSRIGLGDPLAALAVARELLLAADPGEKALVLSAESAAFSEPLPLKRAQVGRDELQPVVAQRLDGAVDVLDHDGRLALLRPVAAEHLAELIAAFEAEADHGLKCWLLDLIGEARSETALPLLQQELSSPDESLRDWAAPGLRLLDTKRARSVLWERRLDANE